MGAKFGFFVFSAFLFVFHESYAGTFVVDYPNRQFLKDGKPFQYIAGELHYFRIHPELWNDRLQRVRALGLNAIQVYIPWNLHEPFEGTFDFSGIVNITRFLDLAVQNNLYVLLRPGPYICAEWEFGGFPWWLIKKDGVDLRTWSPPLIAALQNFYTTFLAVLKPYTYQNGGPILTVQVENEYGLWGKCNHNYTAFLRDLYRSVLGNDTVLYTTNPLFNNQSVECGVVPDTLTTVDFGTTTDHSTIDQHFEMQMAFNNGSAPKVVSEFYPGWLVSWGEKNPSFPSPKVFLDNLAYMHSINASISMYMVHGGTNFGFTNGQEPGENPPGVGDITSYDLHSPISEPGWSTPNSQGIHDWISNLTNWDNKPLPFPANNPVSAYGQVTLARIGSNLVSTLTQIQETCQNSVDPLSFEMLDHPYGFVLYTNVLASGGQTLSTPNIRDYGYVFVNNVFQGMTQPQNQTTINLNLLTKANPGDTLRILVENRGRTKMGNYLDTKGLHANVTLDKTPLQNWYACGINLTKASVDSLTTNFLNDPNNLNQPDLAGNASTPGVYVGTFTANVLQDTFFDSTGWNKGQLFVNGYNLGRYWPTQGPQYTLYVPSPVIQPKNTVLLIELLGGQQNFANFVATPNTGCEYH